MALIEELQHCCDSSALFNQGGVVDTNPSERISDGSGVRGVGGGV